MTPAKLTDREQLVLEAVIRTYVDTAEPAGSRTVARRFELGVSPATVRNTMSDLEEKGYLFHPHTSAGRVPTDQAYRLYVDSLLGQPRSRGAEQKSIRRELSAAGDRSAVELLIRHAAQVLGLLTQELGIAMAPRLDQIVLERLELVSVADGKVLLVLTLRAAGVRTIFVDVPADVPPGSVAAVAQLLNERLAGHTLSEIRMTIPDRLRDAGPGVDPGAAELLNIFIASADDWFELPDAGEPLHLGRASVLADQPEFHSGPRLRNLIELTERTDLLRSILGERIGTDGLQVTIGAEHADPALSDFTVVTSEYRVGDMRGVIGVIGPTRMPYERVIGLVESTSVLVSEFLT
ncbi:MAG TPA: heat-inducible transcriptional repressor HrcA [Longimicrobiaceae bacterium]|nr:heat-inducible transcriptional repressor HrcA [Longimicrobiaceae bacterium]